MCQPWTEEKVKQSGMMEGNKNVVPMVAKTGNFLLAPVLVLCGCCCGKP